MIARTRRSPGVPSGSSPPRVTKRWAARLGPFFLLALLVANPVGNATASPVAATPHGGAALPAVSQGPATTLYRNLSWRGAAPWDDLGVGSGVASVEDTGSAILFGGLADPTGGPAPALVNTTARYWIANNSWQPLAPAHAPSPRQDFGFGEDNVLSEEVLFGGQVNATTLVPSNQTWLYFPDNNSWEEAYTPHAPAARQDAAFAVAPHLGKAVLFGGWNQSAGQIYGDTWYYNLTANNWTEVSASGGPGRLTGASLAWDNALHRFDLFGGCEVLCQNAFWEFDPYNLTWTEVPTTNTPSSRELAAFAYEPAERVDVLYGGEGSEGPLGDTWEYEPFAHTWLLQSTSLAPPDRDDAASGWVPADHNESLFLGGGSSGSGAPLTDAWLLSPTGNVPVQVVSSTTGLPIDSATVTADGSFAAVTSLQGFGNATGVAPGSVVVAASAAGYGSASQSLWLYPAENASLVILRLVPAPQGKLDVRVFEAPGMTVPLAGADVNVTIGGVALRTPPLTTNSRGYANYTNVPSGVTADLSAWEQDYHATSSSILVPLSGVAYWNTSLTSLPVLTLHTVGTNALPASDMYDFPNVLVWFNDSPTLLSGAGGWLNATFARGGPLTVSGTYPGYGAGWANQSLGYTGHLWGNLTLLALYPTEIYVNVTSAATGQELSGVDVNDSFSNGQGYFQGVTDAKGIVNDSRIRTGPNFLEVWAAGYYAQLAYQFLVPNRTLWLNISLVPLPSLVLRVWGLELNGDLDPLAGTLVLYGGIVGGTTNSRGYLNFTPARAGYVELEGEHPLYKPGFENLTVNTTGTTWTNLTLDHLPWAVLEVQVRDQDDQLGIVGAQVNATLPGGYNSSISGPHGFVNFTDVVGPGWAGAQALGFYPAVKGTALVADTTTLLVLELVPYTVIHVHVEGENQTAGPFPVGGAAVTFNRTLVGFTDAHGYFNDSQRKGPVTIFVNDSLYFPQQRSAQVNVTGELNESFLLVQRKFATIDVRLIDLTTGYGIGFGYANLTNLDQVPTTGGGVRLSELSGWANFTADLGFGNYSLTGFQDGYRLSTPITILDLNWGEFLTETIYLVPNPYIRLFVTVVNANTSAPISGAEVQVGPYEGFAYVAFSNSVGNTSFPQPYVPGGSYLLEVSATGFWTYESTSATPYDSGRTYATTVPLRPAPPKKCTTGEPGCQPNENGTTTKGSLSLLPFGSGPWWPFLLLPPLFLMGALVVFMASRKPRQRPGQARVVVVPPRPPTPPAAPPG